MDRRQFIQSLMAASGVLMSSGAIATMWQQAEQRNIIGNKHILETLQATLVPVPRRLHGVNIDLVSFISLMIEQSLLSNERVALVKALCSFEKKIKGLPTQGVQREISRAIQSDMYGEMLLKIRDFGLIGLFTHPEVAKDLPATMGFQPCSNNPY